MNFALILVILSLVSGIIYAADVIWWAKKRSAGTQPNKVIEYARSLFPVFFIVLLLRSFLIEPFRIPSGSLEPTLLVGDFLAVNKFAYGLRLPVINKKIVPINTPKTGDITVFRWPPDPSYDYIKRVIGLPGDHVEYKDKVLYINDKKMTQDFIVSTIDESSGKPVDKYQENLNGIVHDIYVRPDVSAIDFAVDVPEGQYFVMGDNRDDSADSRFWGFVADENLLGKAVFVWMSWNAHKDNIRWHKIGTVIK